MYIPSYMYQILNRCHKLGKTGYFGLALCLIVKKTEFSSYKKTFLFNYFDYSKKCWIGIIIKFSRLWGTRTYVGTIILHLKHNSTLKFHHVKMKRNL